MKGNPRKRFRAVVSRTKVLAVTRGTRLNVTVWHTAQGPEECWPVIRAQFIPSEKTMSSGHG